MKHDDWNPLLPFRVVIKDGSLEIGPPYLEVAQYPILRTDAR